MRNTDDLKELEQKDGRRSGKTYHVKNLRLHVAACIAAAAVGIFAAVVGIINLNAEKTSAEEQEEPEEPAISYTYTDMNSTMYATSPVAVRSLPSSLDGEPIGVLSTNQEVIVTGQCNETGWYRIEFDGETAYVNYEFLSEIKVEEPAAKRASMGGKEESAPSYTYTYTDTNATMYAISPVRVRTLPSTDGDVVGTLSTNQEATVTGQCNETGWYRIEFGSETAYVNYMFLSEIKVEVHE